MEGRKITPQEAREIALATMQETDRLLKDEREADALAKPRGIRIPFTKIYITFEVY